MAGVAEDSSLFAGLDGKHEVFTSPELANKMLDTLTEAWSTTSNGADLWADPKVGFLDSCAKSGVVLPEITRRLTTSLEGQVPDLQQRVDHISTKQVFGIALTELTSLLTRQSLYCPKPARGLHDRQKLF